MDDFVWVVTVRNYRDGVLPQAYKHRLIQVFPDRDSAYDFVWDCKVVYDYVTVQACDPGNFLTKYFK